jgi:DNA-binding response OmpR family regulator
MPDTDGVTLLKEWSATGLLSMPVIMMSGHATIDTAVEATRIGAQAFLEKPITLQKLLKAVEQGLAREGTAQGDGGNSTGGFGAVADLTVEAAMTGGHSCCPAGSEDRPPVAPEASISTNPCAMPATNSKRPTSNSTWPRKAAP